MTLEQQLESGLAHHRAGRLAEAENIYPTRVAAAAAIAAPPRAGG